VTGSGDEDNRVKQVYQPTDVFDPHTVFGSGSYRQVVRVGTTVYIAGQAAIDLEGNVIGRGDIEAQSVAVCENLLACLRDAGATVQDLVKVTTYYTDREQRATIGAVRRRYLGEAEFVHTGLIITGLADPDLLLEIEAIAEIGSGAARGSA
jgi:enamine deaminase RidA (YjgF/YER057c/UK114 family)